MRAIFLSLFIFAVCRSAQAGIAGGPHRHEALLNASVGATANVDIGSTGERFEFAAGYLYAVGNLVQLGAVVGTGYRGRGFLNVQGAVNFNVATSDDGRHSFFVGATAGWDDVTRSTRAFVWTAGLGVRYRLFEHLYWRPTAGVTDQGTGVGVVGELLALSLAY